MLEMGGCMLFFEGKLEKRGCMVMRSNFFYRILMVVLMASSLLPVMGGLRTEIFNPGFRTLKVGVLDNFMSAPVIRMNSDDRLVISFDEIAEQESRLQYRILHFNSDWERSGLVGSEYLEGFGVEDIEDVGFSENTFVHYVNYRVELPNESIRFASSGNYMIQVYPQSDPERILLQARFQVSEDLVGITGEADGRTMKGLNTRYQQLGFVIDSSRIPSLNPYQDLRVEVSQNGTAESRRVVSAPLRVEGSRIVYSQRPELVFDAGNEYHRFEAISNQIEGLNIDSIRQEDGRYHVWLRPDETRVSREYDYDRTQHGRFMVREYNSTDSDLGADYVMVHFSLRHPRLRNQDVYVDGELNQWNLTEKNRMVYNRERGCYELELPLKQGSYNYRYVVLGSDGSGAASASPIEGDKFETENEYQVSVYYRPPGSRYDRLIGFQTIYTK